MKYNNILKLLLIFSILSFIILYFFENIRIPVILNINPARINSLIEILSLTFISSFIFYYVVVRLKDKADKKNIYPFIADYTYIMMNNCIYFCDSMRNWAKLENKHFNTGIENRNLNVYPNIDELKQICKNIDPNKEEEDIKSPPGFRAIPHFFGIMIHFTLRIDYFLDILLTKSNFLDTDLLRILTDIKTSGYHQDITSHGRDKILMVKHRHNNLNVYISSLNYYFILFKKLEIYAEKNLKKYVERDSIKNNNE